jgi:anti-sigma regulatory factor (Ser/Thr protein kinase)
VGIDGTVVAHAPEALLSAVISPAAWELRALRCDLRGWLGRVGFEHEQVEDVVLAVHEAAANAVEHAYVDGERQPIYVDGEVDRGILRIMVRDCGTWRQPWGGQNRGRGIGLMSQLVEVSSIERGKATAESGTTVTLMARMFPQTRGTGPKAGPVEAPGREAPRMRARRGGHAV